MNLKTIKEKIKPIPSFITDDDIECYYKYASKINGVILDVGTGWGKSMVALALSNQKATVVSCDPGTTPIQQGWAKDEKEYLNKIVDLINSYALNNALFFCGDVLSVIPSTPSVSLLHLDNWVELNQVDSDELLIKLISVVSPGGYLLFRNYGHGDRQPYTDSVDRVTKDLNYIETKGLIKVFQK